MRGWPISRILSPVLPRMDDHSSRSVVTNAPLAANPDLLGCKPPRRERRAIPIWHCSRWGLPCRLRCRSRGGLLLHRFTFSCADTGSLFSVALSLGLPPPGVTRHRALLESGLSSDVTARDHPAIRASRGLDPSGVCVNGEASCKVSDHASVNWIKRPLCRLAKTQPEDIKQ